MKKKVTIEIIEENIKYFKCGEYNKMHKELQTIGISISYDMGWQKRATGRIYDSLSGHGYFIGYLGKNIVQYGLMKKKCSTCIRQNSLSLPFRSHRCAVNWEGSSGAMEAGLALKLVLEIEKTYGELVYIKEIVTDDDSTMRAQPKKLNN